MGLNLDIAHVAFSGLDQVRRAAAPASRAERAGPDRRPGRALHRGRDLRRHRRGAPLDPEVVEAIESHRFAPSASCSGATRRLDFGSPAALIASLEAPSGHGDLVRAREADDVMTLKALVDLPDVRDRAARPADVRLLWDVCQVPDFRKVSLSEHASLSARLWGFLHDGGGCRPTGWRGR
jgi:ATP-dependent RNA helicase SUPV3L1/SUV3